MIVFRKIFWKNLLSTGNIGIEIDLDSTKTTILFGSSGSGKSTLLDALTFCLFNKPFRNINKPKLVNGINEGDCLVRVEFESNSNHYKIVRGVKPNIFEIYENGKLLNQDANSRDYQSVLENQILKINYRTFLQVVMLGAANFTPFMQLKPSDRRLIIEELLDIQVFSVMNGLLKEKISDIKQRSLDVESRITSINQKIDLLERHIKSLEGKKKDNIKSIQSVILDIEKSKEETESHKKELQSKRSSLVIQSLSQVEALFKKYNDIQVTLKNNRSRLLREIEFYKTTDWCNTCKQSISEEVKGKEIESKTTALSEIDNGLANLDISLSDLTSKKASIIKEQDEIKNIDQRIRELDISISFYNDNITKHRDSISKLELADDELISYQNDFQYSLDIKKSLEEEKSKIFKENQLIEYATLILKDNGVKSKIIKEYVPYINKYVNTFLNAMSFFVSFKLDENFEEQIKSKGRDFFSYENFSEGERQRLDLALLFTWRCVAKAKNSVNTNLLIMDEVLDSYLDTSATENVLSIFKESMFDDTNIVVISHKENIVDKFDRVIKYKIEKGFSKVEF